MSNTVKLKSKESQPLAPEMFPTRLTSQEEINLSRHKKHQCGREIVPRTRKESKTLKEKVAGNEPPSTKLTRSTTSIVVHGSRGCGGWHEDKERRLLRLEGIHFVSRIHEAAAVIPTPITLLHGGRELCLDGWRSALRRVVQASTGWIGTANSGLKTGKNGKTMTEIFGWKKGQTYLTPLGWKIAGLGLKFQELIRIGHEGKIDWSKLNEMKWKKNLKVHFTYRGENAEQ